MTADEAIVGAKPETRLGDLRRVPGYPQLFVSSFIWHTTRWGGLFTTSYLLAELVGSPILSQVVGALIFAPMLLGGFVAGMISDRVERRKLILAVQALLIPVEFAMSAAVWTGAVEVWMTMPFMFLVGIGGLVNMTAQRPLIYETVGPVLASRALTIESTAQAGSAMVGTLVGGILIETVGMGAGFASMGILLCVSAILLFQVPTPRYGGRRNDAPFSIAAQFAASAALVRRSRRLVATLGITVVMNLCMFGYIPLIPIVAGDYTTSATLIGALAAAPGCGQIAAGIGLSARQLERHGLVFAVGSGIALCGLLAFATAPALGVAFLALFVSGLGQAAFGSMQSLLAIESAGESERGAALGVLSTCIGALPVGMIVIGAGAEALGPRTALTASALVGLTGLVMVVVRRSELLARSPLPEPGNT
jgi:MFS family permease